MACLMADPSLKTPMMYRGMLKHYLLHVFSEYVESKEAHSVLKPSLDMVQYHPLSM